MRVSILLNATATGYKRRTPGERIPGFGPGTSAGRSDDPTSERADVPEQDTTPGNVGASGSIKPAVTNTGVTFHGRTFSISTGCQGTGWKPQPLPATREEMMEAIAQLAALRLALAYQITAHLERFGYDYPSSENGSCLYCGKVASVSACEGCNYRERKPRSADEAAKQKMQNDATAFLPATASSGGYTYIVAFGNRTIKIGSTTKPAQRFTTLESQAEAFGSVIARWWVSPQHLDYKGTERFLLASARKLGGTPRGREYFADLDFDRVLELACGLRFGVEAGP